MSNTPIVEQFDELVGYGLQVIPLWENSKAPMCKGWTIWNYRQNREVLQRYPDANIGLLLGDIVDVEGDSEYANRTILKLIGNYPHPCYKSTKSIHHLFVNPDPDLRIVKHQDIEFRGFKHQSVLPPSHHQGVSYEWVSNQFPIPEMPIQLANFYRKLRDKKRIIRPGYMPIRCAKCYKRSFINRQRFSLELEAFKKLQMPWECRKCRVIDVRPLCRGIRQRRRRTHDSYS